MNITFNIGRYKLQFPIASEGDKESIVLTTQETLTIFTNLKQEILRREGKRNGKTK